MDKTTEIILEVENVEIISCEQSFKIVSYCTHCCHNIQRKQNYPQER